MNNVWWTIVTFFRKLFVPPEFTPLESELLRQLSHMEGQLFKEREKYEELVSRLLFPSNGPNVEQSNVTFSVPTSVPSPRERRKQLEELSKVRAHQAYLDRADKLVADAEERMKNREQKESPAETSH